MPAVTCLFGYVVYKLIASITSPDEVVTIKQFFLHTRAAFIILIFLMYNKVQAAAECVAVTASMATCAPALSYSVIMYST